MTAIPSRVPQLLTIPVVADQLGVSTKTVRRWIDHGELQVHRLGRQIRVAEADIVAFLDSRRK